MISLLAFFYFCLLSIYFTWPLIFNLENQIIGLYDELFTTWTINWVIHALTSNPLLLFQANIFYPYKNTLAYSDIQLASSLLALPFIKLFDEPILAFNINLLAGFILTGFFTFLLVKYLTKSSLAGIISGTIISFSTIHLNYLGHLQLFCLQYFILGIYLYFKFLAKKNFFNLTLFLIISFLATLNNFLIGYFLVFSILIISFFKKEFKGMGVFLAFLLITTLPFFLPYFKVSRQFNYVRPIRDAIHFSLQPEDLLYPSSNTRIEKFLLDFFKLRPKEANMKTTPGYLGLAFYFLGFLSVGYGFKKKLNKKKAFLIFLFIGIIGLILSFGPVMHWGRKTIHQPFIIPLPYAILYYLLPGFSGFRTPSRFILLFSFALAVIIGIVFQEFSRKWFKITRFLLTVFICFLIVLEFNFPFHYFQLEKKVNYPQVYYYLERLNELPRSKLRGILTESSLSYLLHSSRLSRDGFRRGDNKKAPILEMPILNWDSYDLIFLETRRELYSTLSFRRMVNGYSGFTPPEREVLMKKIMLEFPNKELIKWLREIKVKYLIIHKNDYRLLEKSNFSINGKKIVTRNQLLKRISEYKKEFSLIKEVNSDLIYEIKN